MEEQPANNVNEEDTISLAEIIQESQDLEDTAVAVLGGSDSEKCSYDKGYVKRQALYACLTCNPVTSPTYAEAGVCLACSLKCHRGHDLVELYTKRNFRCDCGNKKFQSSECHCQLQPIKSDFNSENRYNQNFRGVYCICERPYPDPEEDDEDVSSDEDEMIQCVVCEDWFHGRHTENDQIDLESDSIHTSDFVCKACGTKCGFLAHYGEFMLKVSAGVDANTSLVDESPSVIEPIADADTANAEKTSESPKCFLEANRVENSQFPGGTWWAKDWRSKLCKCEKCTAMYGMLGVSFLIDAEDPLEVYEAQGREKAIENPIGGGELEALFGEMDRVKQIEVIHAYNEMKEGLSEMVERVSAAGRPLSREDVQVFFENLKSKRRRLDVYVPDNCR